MKRIDGADRAVDLFGAGKDGFKGQVPGVSLATQINAKWFNAVQESIVRTIEAAGLSLSEADYDQFVSALNVLDLAARNAAITAAAADATTKANSAQTAAITAAATDATTKANSAQTAAITAAATDATTKANAVIPSGTRMLFQQTAAPVGWTKDATHNNKTLRVVSGAVVNGGSVAFTAAFVNGTVGDTALTVAQMPAHTHGLSVPLTFESGAGSVADGSGATTGTASLTTGSTGGGATHNHTLNLDVMYVDVIIASKN